MRANLILPPPVVVSPMQLPPLEMRTIRVALTRIRPASFRTFVPIQKIVGILKKVFGRIRNMRSRRRITVRRARRESVRAGPVRPRLTRIL